MHRSGSSCLAGSLEEQGLCLADVDRLPHTNPKGNRENREIMHLNNAVLADCGATWDEPPAGDAPWQSEHKAWRDKIIATYPKDRIWGFKDPRTLFTLGGWLEVLPEARLIASFRHPVPVARSLEARNKFPMEKGLEIWLRYNRRLLEVCGDHEVRMISFDSSTAEYQEGIRSLSAFVGLPYSGTQQSFFEAGLRRNSTEDEYALPPEVARVYEELLARV